MTRNPGPDAGMESVWDYPRPPRVEPCLDRATVHHRGIVVADSTLTMRVLETSHPPGIYIPPGDVDTSLLRPSPRTTVCEYRGRAAYWHLVVEGDMVRDAAWSYPDPAPGYEAIRDHLAFYPGRVDECRLGDERVTPQEGSFYGGWITSHVIGPFKGGPGTTGW
jgi:uncharacterized protein (DUF427 family)